MRLSVLVEDKWRFLIMESDNGKDPILSAGLGAAHRAGLLAVLERAASHELGLRCLPDNRCHAISRDPKILQISDPFPLRIALFIDGRDIVCTHAFRKAGGKGNTRPAEIRKALRARADYFDDKVKGALKIIY